MGSQAIQSHLWGQRPQDWAAIQETTSKSVYEHILDLLKLTPTDKLLDIGCGSGFFCSLAAKSGAHITGFDATAALIEEAKKRDPSITFLTGDMEELPFADNSFDVVSGFNSFQYAADIKKAFAEAKRVLKNDGWLAVMIWGNKEECEAATYLKAVGSLLPPPPSGASGPFALSENGTLEEILEQMGFITLSKTDEPVEWHYENTDQALRGLLSAGPTAKAIGNSGFDKVYETISLAMRPYIQPNGHVVYHNKFRVIIARK